MVDLGLLPASSPVANIAHVYNVLNPWRFGWSTDLLPALHSAGLEFESLPPAGWLSRLKQTDQDPDHNPTIKLLPLLSERYGKASQADRQRDFVLDEAKAASESIRDAPDIIRGGYIHRFVEQWLQKWTVAA